MSIIKDSVDIANKLTNLLIQSSHACFDDKKEEEEIYDAIFDNLFECIKGLNDEEFLHTINSNIDKYITLE